jgi:hypothetical protein
MDEIKMFETLRPPAPDGTSQVRQAARSRLDKELAGPLRTRSAHRHRRALMLAGATATAAVAAVAVFGLLPGGGSGPFVTSAWAVQRNANGTITVTFKDAQDAAGLQSTLQADGVAAYVRSLAPTSTCVYQQVGGNAEAVSTIRKVLSPPTGSAADSATAVTINPSAMPAGTAILIQVTVPGPGSLSVAPTLLGNDNPPTCAPPPARHS